MLRNVGAVASGIFNLHLHHDDAAWQAHTLGVLAEMDRSSRLGSTSSPSVREE
jgi:hypothetical protein